MRIEVQGRHPLRGSYQVSGSSNAAMTLIAASMLTTDPVTLHHMPDTLSVATMLRVGESLGMTLQREGDLTLQTPGDIGRSLEREHTDVLSGTLLFLGPILARRHYARVAIDYAISRLHPHLTALRDLGIGVTVDRGVINLEANAWDSAEIVLVQTSVTATALVAMLAAVLGQQTVVHNAASEPQITDLLNILHDMGAPIEGIGSNQLTIRGVAKLHGAQASVSPDHVEAASVGAIAAITGGRLTIEGVQRRDLRLIVKVYERLGLRLSLDEDALIVPTHERFELSAREEDVDVSIESAPWPGFPSDLIAMATVVATQGRGSVLIHEKLFNNRLLFVDRLNGMGAQIVLCDPHRAIVVGPSLLAGEYVDNPDVRTGLAMLGAALCASGTTVIDNAETFDRNFDHVIDKLIALGANIKRP
ncbi:MAG TPA: UDP-N-acetylglucosamine 1-carboxyvinyltransferase [Aggregatilineales bacterium]|nr:UDP-N-acetylglucosamine 1-carboxyvinyltransferase [Aggregatilineales bacterium]